VLVTEEERLEYQTFAAGIAKKLGFNSDPPKTLWHYTTADGLLGILESASIYATQLGCLNDVSELRYAMHMVQNAMRMLRARTPGDDPDRDYIFDLIDRVAGADTVPTSDLYVACFSGKEDDLSQWRAYGGGENGYALAFQTQFLFSQHSIVAPVSYDHQLHLEVAGEVAAAFLDFKLRGLKRGYDRETWTLAFANAWSASLGMVGPMVKHPAFAAENEYRCIHTLDPGEHGSLEFRQKGGMLARHFPLFFPPPGKPRERMLPIVEVMVGQGCSTLLGWLY